MHHAHSVAGLAAAAAADQFQYLLFNDSDPNLDADEADKDRDVEGEVVNQHTAVELLSFWHDVEEAGNVILKEVLSLVGGSLSTTNNPWATTTKCEKDGHQRRHTRSYTG